MLRGVVYMSTRSFRELQPDGRLICTALVVCIKTVCVEQIIINHVSGEAQVLLQ